MRIISASMTAQQIIDEIKLVTRRLGWLNLKVGDLLQVVEKAQGLKKGEKMNRLKVIRVTGVHREPLNAITQEEVIAEGFPNMTPNEFIQFFCKGHKECTPTTLVTVIHFEYVPLHKVGKCQQLPPTATLKGFEEMESALDLWFAESMGGNWYLYSKIGYAPKFYDDKFDDHEKAGTVWEWWVSEGKAKYQDYIAERKP